MLVMSRATLSDQRVPNEQPACLNCGKPHTVFRRSFENGREVWNFDKIDPVPCNKPMFR